MKRSLFFIPLLITLATSFHQANTITLFLQDELFSVKESHNSTILMKLKVTMDTFFVAIDGNDAKAGTEEQPWQTFQKACNTATPGSTVLVKAGIYNEKVTVNVSGNAMDGFITFQNYGSDTVILDGIGKSGDQIILIEDKSYIKIIGFELQNNLNQIFGTGIWVKGHGDHIEIRKNRIRDMRAIPGGGDAMGISVYGTNAITPISHIIIDSNQIYDCEPGHSESLVLNGNVDTFQVTNNIIHDNDNIGIDMIGGEETCPTPTLDLARNGVCRGNTVYNCNSSYGGGYAAGIYVDGGKNIRIERNRVYQCDVGIEVGCENQGRIVEGIIVRNNLIYNNGKRGLSFGGYDYPRTGYVRDCHFTNNTIFQNDALGTEAGELVIEYALTCTVMHNIFCSTAQNRLLTTAVGNSSGNLIDYNLWYTPGGINNASIDYAGNVYSSFTTYQLITAQDAHSVFGNPLFISPILPNPDLNLQTGSVAIDVGDPLFIPGPEETDFDGKLRIVNARVDAGAYEYTSTSSLTTPTLVVPLNGVTGVPVTSVFRWESCPYGVRYHIQIGLDSGFTQIVHDALSITDTFYVLNQLNNYTRYFWRVRAMFGSMVSNWSDIWSFTTVLSSPKIFSAMGLSTIPTFTWNQINGVIKYHLQVSVDSNFTTITYEDSTIDDTSHTTDMMAEESYIVRVCGGNVHSWGDWSNVLYFKSVTDETLFVYLVMQGWNMMSIPLDVRDILKTSLFPTAVSNAYRYTGTYTIAYSLITGDGYWIKFTEDQPIILTGKSLPEMIIQVHEGWNIIGSMNSKVHINQITSEPPGLVTSQLFGYRDNYYSIDTLYPSMAYWIKVSQPGTLILTNSVSIPTNRIHINYIQEKPPKIPDAEASTLEPEILKHFVLHQNYPNPFNPTTTIEYQLPVDVSRNDIATYKVTLKVYNVLGQEVKTLVDEIQDAGYKSVEWRVDNQANGVYFYRLTTKSEGKSIVAVKKLLLMK